MTGLEQSFYFATLWVNNLRKVLLDSLFLEFLMWIHLDIASGCRNLKAPFHWAQIWLTHVTGKPAGYRGSAESADQNVYTWALQHSKHREAKFLRKEWLPTEDVSKENPAKKKMLPLTLRNHSINSKQVQENPISWWEVYLRICNHL